MYFTGNIFSHYCQALGSLGLTNSAKEFAHYAYYNALLMEDIYNASGLKNDLKKITIFLYYKISIFSSENQQGTRK